MLQDLWSDRERLAAEKAQVDIEDDDGHSDFGRLLYALDGEIADIVPQTLDECRLHAWLLVHEWCSEATGCSRDAIDTRLAKSLLAALERLAGRAQS